MSRGSFMQLSLFDVQLCLFDEWVIPYEQPVPRKEAPCDPYRISEDGHYVNVKDGFVVPNTFAEFYERFPKYIKQFVLLKLRNKQDWEREEHENDLIVFLLTIPADSKYKVPGYNGYPNGCEDRLQIFNPEQSFGCAMPRWKSWLNRCLQNELYHQLDKQSRSPLHRFSTIPLDDKSPPGSPEGMRSNDEFIIEQARQWSGASRDTVVDLTKEVHVSEFLTFVAKHNPELLEVTSALGVAENRAEACKYLAWRPSRFKRAYLRLRLLEQCFTLNRKPPNQRPANSVQQRSPQMLAAA